MIVEIKMPRMGQSMEQGSVVEWLIKVGDMVEKSDPIAEIETDKAIITFESLTAGKVEKLLVNPGEVVPVGTTLVIIEDGKAGTVKKQEQSHESFDEKSNVTLQQKEAPSVFVDPNKAETQNPQRVIASPLAKRIAQERGIDLRNINGSGPRGMISTEDVEDYLSKLKDLKSYDMQRKVNNIPLNKIKRITAERMTGSKQTIPHFYISMDVDMGEAIRLRESFNKQGVEVTINDLIIKATALSLMVFPNLNAQFKNDTIAQRNEVDIAMAVSIDEGLITPVIKNCERLSIYEIANKTKGMIERARNGKLYSEEVEAGTFTISNLGMFGVKNFLAIINPPHAAILAVGNIQNVPTFDSNNYVVSAALMNVTLSADHRVTDGVEVAKFLQKLKEVLEDGYALLKEDLTITKNY